MWPQIILEAGLIIAVLVTAISFWAVAKASGHLRQMLHDSYEMSYLIGWIGPEKLLKEAESIKPIWGSYGANILLDLSCHVRSLRQTTLLSLVLCTVALVATCYLLGIGYLIANLVVAFVPVLF